MQLISNPQVAGDVSYEVVAGYNTPKQQLLLEANSLSSATEQASKLRQSGDTREFTFIKSADILWRGQTVGTKRTAVYRTYMQPN